MLLTRRSSGAGGGVSPSGALVDSLARGAARAIPTLDRREFLRGTAAIVGGCSATM